MNRLEKLYFTWLIDGVIPSKETQKNYSMVLEKLFDTEFISYDIFDDNLLENSISMRTTYYDFSKTAVKLIDIYGEIDRPPTVLEIMVYLAERIENSIMYNSDFGSRTELWFWLMMESLDIKKYKNSRYNESEVERKLNNFIERRYEKNGYGGLFTIYDLKNDARKMNIWQQAMEFLSSYAKKNGELI